MEITVINKQNKIKADLPGIKKTALSVLKKLKVDGELNIVITDNRKIRRLNREYRKKDYPTDVLSFSQDKINSFCLPRYKVVLGDIVISIEKAKINAKQYSLTLDEEVKALVRHGILHLCGFSHSRMKKLFFK